MIYHTQKNEHSNNLTCSNCGFDIFSAQTNISSTIDLDYKDDNLIIRCAKCDQEHLIPKTRKKTN